MCQKTSLKSENKRDFEAVEVSVQSISLFNSTKIPLFTPRHVEYIFFYKRHLQTQIIYFRFL